MSDEIGFFQKSWAQIVSIATLLITFGAAQAKVQVDNRRLKKAVFDGSGNIRLLSVEACSSCKTEQEKEREKYHKARERELQNIHGAIADLNKAVRDVPSAVMNQLEKMGHLK